MLKRLVLATALLLAVALVACSEGGVPAPTSTPSPTATSTPVNLGPPEPEAARILEHIRSFSVEIGIRPAGSSQEQRAIDYAREQFESWGYEFEVQTFTAAGPDILRLTTVDVEQPEQRHLGAIAFRGSGTGDVSGRLVDVGTGREEEFPPEAAGAIVLIQRKDVLFADMARRAEQAGAAAAVVANRETGRFRGEIDPPAELPVVAVSQEDGEALRELLARPGGVEVSLSVKDEIIAHNVVARPASGRCRTLSGGHFDSVPWAAGATDNASGSALVLELARAAAAAHLSGHCFILFGAEEIGLEGSAYFVSQLSDAEKAALEAVFNYDVVGGDAPPLLLGSEELVDRAEALADQAGIEVEASNREPDIGSDHLSFLDADIPALMLTTPDFGRIHTPEDTFANLQPTFLDEVAELAFALLRQAGRAP